MKIKKSVVFVKLWKRVVAYFIDIVILNLVVVYPFKGFFGNFEEDVSLNEFSIEIVMVFLIISAMTVAYWSILEYFLKQSVGKSLLNIYVRSTEKELNFWQCVLRNLSKVSILVLFIDCLRIIFKKEHQRYLEKLSKTEVFDEE